MTSKASIGCIGVGLMGMPMAKRAPFPRLCNSRVRHCPGEGRSSVRGGRYGGIPARRRRAELDTAAVLKLHER